MTQIISILVLLIIIIIILHYLNIYLKPNIEKYGTYCGKYNMNLDENKNKLGCKKDPSCSWNEYTNSNGKKRGWCGLRPEPEDQVMKSAINYRSKRD